MRRTKSRIIGVSLSTMTATRHRRIVSIGIILAYMFTGLLFLGRLCTQPSLCDAPEELFCSVIEVLCSKFGKDHMIFRTRPTILPLRYLLCVRLHIRLRLGNGVTVKNTPKSWCPVKMSSTPS